MLIKRITALFTAIAVLSVMTTVCSFSASAYDDCDVNHDGDVDVSDLVVISRYLAGNLYCADYNRFDTNRSLTVDSADYDKIMAIIAKLTYQAEYWSKSSSSAVSFPMVSGFTPDLDATMTTGRTYRRYSYSTNQELSSYTLTPTNVSLLNNLDNMEDRFIDNDNQSRTIASENTGIVSVVARDSESSGSISSAGSGFIVGKYIIATAANNIYGVGDGNTAHFYPNLTIQCFNSNGTQSNISLHPLEVHIPDSYYINVDEGGKYDYALITVQEDLSSYTRFRLGTTYNVSQSNYANIPLYVPWFENNSSLQFSEGHILNSLFPSYTENLLFYDNSLSMFTHEYGAPVYTITREQYGNNIIQTYTAIAINTIHTSQSADGSSVSGYTGTRITKYHLQFYDAHTNPYIPY